jgi:hypothetical protein
MGRVPSREDVTTVQARCYSLFLRIELRHSNLPHMKAHASNRKDVASPNAPALPIFRRCGERNPSRKRFMKKFHSHPMG